MAIIVSSNPAVKSAAELAAALLADGWREGAPPHLSERARRIDVGILKQQRCPKCCGRGMAYRPYHKGNAYTVVSACPRCGSGEDY
jgi:hypothetical protein